MENIKKKINELNQLSNTWVEIIKRLDEEEYNELDENVELVIKAFMELLDLCKKQYKIDDNVLDQELNNCMESEDAQWLFEIINNSLKIYRNILPLRNLEEENKEMVKIVIRYIFDNVLLRFDPEFINNFAAYKFRSEDDLKDIARMLNLLTKFYITKHFSARAMKEDFQNETNLSDDTCDYYVSLVETNYLSLQLNHILDQISE